MKQKITPFLWFNSNAEEAIEFYKKVFGDVKVINSAKYPEGSPGPAGQLMTATIELMGQQFMLLNGGPQFSFTEAISFVIDCSNQQEVDRYWDMLSDGGKTSQCGWLKDRFGLWWQVVPSQLGELMGGQDKERSQRVMQAMLKMSKIDIAALEKAANDAVSKIS